MKQKNIKKEVIASAVVLILFITTLVMIGGFKNKTSNNTIYFYQENNEYKYTKQYNKIENKNNIISKYKCYSNCEINMQGLAFTYNNNDKSKVMIYEANENILYDIQKGVIGKYGTDARWLYSNDDEYMNGTYIYIKSDKSNKYGIIDKNGKVIKDFVLEKTNGIYSNNAEMLKSSYSVENNMIVNVKNNKYGIIKITGNEIVIDYLYDNIELLNDKYFKVKENNKWYLYSFEKKDKEKEESYIDLMIIDNILFSINEDNNLYIENGNNIIKEIIDSKYKYLVLGNEKNSEEIVFFISEYKDLSLGNSIKYKYNVNNNTIIQE